MAANMAPIFPKAAAIGMASGGTANISRTFSSASGLVKVIDAGADGTRIDAMQIAATAATAAGIVRLIVSDGTSWKLFDEIPISAITPSATVAAFTKTVAYPSAESAASGIIIRAQLVLPSGWSLWFATHNTEALNVIAFGGHY